MISHSRPWLTLFRFGGADHKPFLQGQITQDVGLLAPEKPAMLAASCDAKGRVLAVLTLIYSDDAIMVAVRNDIAEAWCEQLLRFRLRAKVTVDIVRDQFVSADTGIRSDLFAITDHSGVADGARWRIGDGIEWLDQHPSGIPTRNHRKLRLLAGIAEPGPATAGKFTPHMLGLQNLSALSFSKGCYTGQEIVARTEHLGVAKRGPVRLQSCDGAAISEGVDVIVGGRKQGVIAAACDNTAIAVVALDSDGAMETEDGRQLQRLP